MTEPMPFLSPGEAARRLRVSIKALRLYEARGLLAPARSAAGWRAYGPETMARAAEVAALRRMGLSVAQIARVVAGDPHALGPALAAHQDSLERQTVDLDDALRRVRAMRADIGTARSPELREPSGIDDPAIAFDLPWPWGGERFALREITALTYITGPLGSGKTRLARRLAEALPGARFLGLDRLDDHGAAAKRTLPADPALTARIAEMTTQLVAGGARRSEALLALLVGLHAEHPSSVVVDMVEQGLDGATQAALMSCLRRRGADAPPLVLLTRSNAILDLAAAGTDETIVYCPANHAPPLFVTARPGAFGYEALTTCLASPEVRARTAGVVATRTAVAQTAL